MSVNSILIEIVSRAEGKELWMLPTEENDKGNSTDTAFNQLWPLLNTNRRKLLAENCVFHFFRVANGYVNDVNCLGNLFFSRQLEYQKFFRFFFFIRTSCLLRLLI